LAPYPAAHQMSGVLKTGKPGCIPIKGAECNVACAVGGISVAALDTEIQFRDPGQLRDIDSREPSRNIWAKNRRNFVMFGETLSVKGHSVSQTRNPVAE